MNQNNCVPTERIEKHIFLMRGQKVILDSGLAQLYEVETKQLVRAVKRNIERFPDDFMFQLTFQEVAILRCQFGTSRFWGGRRYLPFAFTEYGVAMLSSVLNSRQAVQVNIQIMRTFGRLREMIFSHKELAKKLAELEKKYDSQFKIVFDTIRQLISAPPPQTRKIGFSPEKLPARS